MSRESRLQPWNPATIAIAPSSSASRSRTGVTCTILAEPWRASVIMPAWLPVYERASMPMLLIAIASSAIEMRSPVVSSMSSSRGSGIGVTSRARSSSSSVVSPMALTATTTSLPALRVSTMRLATRLMLSASATDEPPYFWTMRLTGSDYRRRERGTGEGSSVRLLRTVGEKALDELGGVVPVLDGMSRHPKRLDRVVVAVGVEPIADEEHVVDRDAGELGELVHAVRLVDAHPGDVDARRA